MPLKHDDFLALQKEDNEAAARRTAGMQKQSMEELGKLMVGPPSASGVIIKAIEFAKNDLREKGGYEATDGWPPPTTGEPRKLSVWGGVLSSTITIEVHDAAKDRGVFALGFRQDNKAKRLVIGPWPVDEVKEEALAEEIIGLVRKLN